VLHEVVVIGCVVEISYLKLFVMLLLMVMTMMGVTVTMAVVIIIIIIIERTDLGGVMSKDCKDTLQMRKTVTKRECNAK